MRLLPTLRALFGPLEDRLQDPDVSEVLVAGPDRVLISSGGMTEAIEVPLTRAKIRALADRLLRTVAPGHSLKDGGRGWLTPDLEALVLPESEGGGAPIIRLLRHPTRVPSLDDLSARGVLDRAAEVAIEEASRDGLSVVIAGRQRSGKSELFAALVRALETTRRVAVIDTDPGIISTNGQVTRVASSGAGRIHLSDRGGVQAALAVGAEVIAVDQPSSSLWRELLLSGRPFLATIESLSARAALGRITARLLSLDASASRAGAEALVGAAIDLLIEMRRENDRVRVRSLYAPAIDQGALDVRIYGSATVPNQVTRPTDRALSSMAGARTTPLPTDHALSSAAGARTTPPPTDHPLSSTAGARTTPLPPDHALSSTAGARPPPPEFGVEAEALRAEELVSHSFVASLSQLRDHPQVVTFLEGATAGAGDEPGPTDAAASTAADLVDRRELESHLEPEVLEASSDLVIDTEMVPSLSQEVAPAALEPEVGPPFESEPLHEPEHEPANEPAHEPEQEIVLGPGDRIPSAIVFPGMEATPLNAENAVPRVESLDATPPPEAEPEDERTIQGSAETLEAYEAVKRNAIERAPTVLNVASLSNATPTPVVESVPSTARPATRSGWALDEYHRFSADGEVIPPPSLPPHDLMPPAGPVPGRGRAAVPGSVPPHDLMSPAGAPPPSLPPHRASDLDSTQAAELGEMVAGFRQERPESFEGDFSALVTINPEAGDPASVTNADDPSMEALIVNPPLVGDPRSGRRHPYAGDFDEHTPFSPLVTKTELPDDESAPAWVDPSESAASIDPRRAVNATGSDFDAILEEIRDVTKASELGPGSERTEAEPERERARDEAREAREAKPNPERDRARDEAREAREAKPNPEREREAAADRRTSSKLEGRTPPSDVKRRTRIR